MRTSAVTVVILNACFTHEVIGAFLQAAPKDKTESVQLKEHLTGAWAQCLPPANKLIGSDCKDFVCIVQAFADQKNVIIYSKAGRKKLRAAYDGITRCVDENKCDLRPAESAADELGMDLDELSSFLHKDGPNPFKTQVFEARVEKYHDMMPPLGRGLKDRSQASIDEASAVWEKNRGLYKAKKAHDEALDKMSETNGAPSQGFTEHHKDDNTAADWDYSHTVVEHDNGVTMTSDWRKEWPRKEKKAEKPVERAAAPAAMASGMLAALLLCASL